MPANPLTTVSTLALELELRARDRAVTPLRARRAKLVADIARIDARLAAKGKAELWRHDKAAVRAVGDALRGEVLGEAEAAAAVVATRALLAELRYIRRGPAAWRARRARVAKMLAEVDARLAGARPPAVPFRRNEITLLDAAVLVLKGKQMTALEVAKAVEAAGYKSLAERPDRVVAYALCTHPELFTRVRRGVYTAR